MGNFPDIPKSISNYLYEEEGNITRNRLLMVGSMAVIMSVLFALEADAGHGSHVSHGSHSDHTSHYSGHSSGHGSHNSHASSTAHSSHGSSSHSNHSSSVASHSNTAHSSQHSSHTSHSSHVNSRPSHGDHGSHASHHSNAIVPSTLPQVLVPQATNNTVLPTSIVLPQLPQISDVPDTVAPTFSVVETIVPLTEKE